MYHKRYDNGGGLFQSSESGFLGGEPQAEKKEEVVSVSETTTPETKPETTEEVKTEQTTFLGIPIGEKKMYGKYEVGSSEYYKHLGRKKDRKYFNPREKWEKAYGEKVGRKKPRYNRYTNGGGMGDYSGNYYSTNDFVGSHNLQELADRIFGAGWQAEDDVNQIERLIESMGGGYVVTTPTDRGEWQDMMAEYGDYLYNKTGDSNYDIFVISEEDFGSDDYNDEDVFYNGGGVGNIPNNYEGKSPKDIWDSWSKEQRKHFLYDHKSDARDSDEVGGSKGYYYSYDIDKWVEMEWNELPYAMIKNLVFEHIDSGQYANGGGVESIPSNSDIFLVVDNSGSTSNYYNYNEIVSNFRRIFPDIKVLTSESYGRIVEIYSQIPEGRGGFDIKSFIDWIEMYEKDEWSALDSNVNNKYIIILTDGNEDFDIDFPNNTIILTTEEGKKIIEKNYPNISANITTLEDTNMFYNGGGVEDNFNYSSGLTDEDMVKENLVNGEISCSILREIIGCDPEYPSQIVGSIKLTKCFLRPYYKIG